MLARSDNPIWFMVDLTGAPLNDQYYAFFLTNTLPYLPQPVYQDPNGISAWSDPLEFQPSGTLPNNLYFNPDLVYRIEIRQGPTQNDPLIWLIENYVPSGSGSNPSQTFFNNSQNLVIDPNFSDISFSSPVTFATSGTYNIAPGWQLILAGTGSSTLTQVALPGSNNLTGNPSYALEIVSTGWTTAQLVQTYNNNGAIFANGAVSMSVLAKTVSNPYTMTLNYVANGSALSPPVAQGAVQAGVYTTISGVVNVGVSANANTGASANVQMTISLPTTDTIFITNVQFIGQEAPVTTFTPPAFQELSYPQIVNQEFYTYRQSLLNEPKNSLLVGWNFGNNPWQFTSPTPANVAANQYTADQTIIIQQKYVTSGTGNNISVGQASLANNYGLEVIAVTANNQFAILQYIAPQSIRQYWNTVMSSMVKAFITTSHSTAVKIKMRLIWIAGLPNTLSQVDPIASWTVNGDPVPASGYTLIAPTNDPVYTLTSAPTEYSFNGFQLPASTNSNMTLGVLVYTTGDINQTATADVIIFNDVSLVANDFALPTQPETFDETLSKCEFYYESSYDVGGLGGTATSNSELIFQQNAATLSASTVMWPNAFSINYKTPKLMAPHAVNIYSPATGTAANVSATANANDYASSTTADYAISNYAADISGKNSAFYIPNNGAVHGPTAGTTTLPQVGYIELHYTVNSCLGNPTLL